MTAQDHVVNNHVVSQANQGGGPQPNESTPTSRILYFIKMNPHTFHGTKVDEDPQRLIDEVFQSGRCYGFNP